MREAVGIKWLADSPQSRIEVIVIKMVKQAPIFDRMRCRSGGCAPGLFKVIIEP